MFERQVILQSGRTVSQKELKGYFVDYSSGNNKIVVTFESANGRLERPEGDRDSWGQKFLESEGFSILAIKPKKVDWYRGEDLHRFFRSEELHQFLAQFGTVLFYGSSMGGYAALTFSSAAKNARVLAHVPQSTLAPDLATWEKRFSHGRNQDWSGDYRDAAAEITHAEKVFITYDPFYGPDARHVERLKAPNVVPLKMPFSSHGAADDLKSIGALKRTVLGAMDGDLSSFPAWARGRKNLATYYLNARKHVGSVEASNACIDHAVRIDPSNVNVAYLKLMRCVEDRDHEGCIRVYESIEKTQSLKNQSKLIMLSATALSYHALGNVKQARKIVTKLVDRTTEDIRFYRNMIQATALLEDFKFSKVFAEKAESLKIAKAAAKIMGIMWLVVGGEYLEVSG